MLALEASLQQLVSLPVITRIGLVIMVLGGLADVAAHLEAAGHTGHQHEHTAAELSAHLIGFVGMVVVLLGIVLDGVRRQRFARPAEHRVRGGK